MAIDENIKVSVMNTDNPVYAQAVDDLRVGLLQKNIDSLEADRKDLLNKLDKKVRDLQAVTEILTDVFSDGETNGGGSWTVTFDEDYVDTLNKMLGLGLTRTAEFEINLTVRATIEYALGHYVKNADFDISGLTVDSYGVDEYEVTAVHVEEI